MRRGCAGSGQRGRLCVKGRFGFDYIAQPRRLTVPLIRRPDAPRTHPSSRAAPVGAPTRPAARPVPRGELGRGARPPPPACGGARRASSGAAGREVPLAGFGSAKGTNENLPVPEADPLGLPDAQRRPLHAAVPRLQRGGADGGSVRARSRNPLRDVEHADLILVIGANPAQNHPVGASWIRNAVRGARLVLADPRPHRRWRASLARAAVPARQRCRAAEAMLHVIVTEGLTDPAFIEARTHARLPGLAQRAARRPGRLQPGGDGPICGLAPDLIPARWRAPTPAPATA